MANRGIRLACIAAVVATALVALAQSWNRWLDPIIDTGRDLYIPEQLLHGARLYSDIRYQYPPLAPYLLAALTGITGHSLAAYTAIGIAITAVTAWLLWWIAERLAGTGAAFSAALMFVAINAAGASTFGANFIFPYTYAATIGMALLLGFAAAVTAGAIPLALILGLAASWCKIEYAIAVTIVLIALLASRVLRLRDLAVYAGGLLVTIAAACAFFGAAALRDNIFPGSLTHGAVAGRFYSLVAGTASWQTTIGQALIGLVAIAATEIGRRRDRRIAMIVGGAAALLLPMNALFRACGVLQWIALARPRDRVMFLLAALSVASTLRVALNVAPIWYGFVLIVPLYLFIVYLTRSEVVWLLLIAIVCARTLSQQRMRWSVKQSPIVTARGTFYDANPDRAGILNAAIPRLRGGTAAVFPEGITLNYLAGVKTPLTFHTFTPAETKTPDVEARIIREMNARPPDRVVLLRRDVREYGSYGFGVDYDQNIVALIRWRYRLEAAWGRPGFDLAILRRVR